jgi:antitoxin (DNA-binding transcriptional repressor) of toxin-antitoxin stability system
MIYAAPAMVIIFDQSQILSMCYSGDSMQEIKASKFKEQCLSLLDHLDPEGLLITKHGKPVARVIPANSGCKDLIGSMKGKIRVQGDILSTGVKWDAES